MSAQERDVEMLARLLHEALPIYKTECLAVAQGILASDWLAEKIAGAEKRGGEKAVREAADAIQALHPGEVKNSVIFLRDFADQIRAGRIGGDR